MRSHWYENDLNILLQVKLNLTRRVFHLASFLKWGFLELGDYLFAICTSPIIHLFSPPKLSITFFFFHFSLVLQLSQEKLNTVQNFGRGEGGGQTRCIMGDVEMENYDKLNQEAFKKNQEKKERRQGLFYETLSKLWIKWQVLHRVCADREMLGGASN